MSHQDSTAERPRPIIAIPTQTLQSLGGVSADIPASWVMSQRYVQTLVTAGALPWLVPLVDDATLRGVYESIDGVFLPGGADIDPATYGTGPHPLCDKTDPERDRVELRLAQWAIADGIPVLGVCRGMQLINVAAGGTLYQDLAEQREGSIKHDYFPFGGSGYTRDYLSHDVSISAGSHAARVFGDGCLRVNSMHHQGVKDVGAGLIVSGVAPDGLPEALEGGNGSYLLAVQWHPEALTDGDECSRRLFSEFISAARDFRSGHI